MRERIKRDDIRERGEEECGREEWGFVDESLDVWRRGFEVY